MVGSDPWDDDDDDELFQDASTLAFLEAQAIQSSQVPKPRQTQRYHHTVAQPKSGPSKSPTFGGRKEPAPLNTEPRAGAGGFGWEYGGKRSIEGNVERHVQMVNDRQAYWSHGHQDITPKNVTEPEEEYPDVVMLENGGYGFDEEAEVVDKQPQETMEASEMRQSQAAAARRAAIIHDSKVAGSSKVIKPSRFPLNRTLSRSVSAGHHPISRPASRGPGPGLSPISSQSEVQLPPSQGSLARKAALELDDERRKRERLETELARLKVDLTEQQRKFEEVRERNENTTDHEEAARGRADEREHGSRIGEVEKKIREMQNELWKAKGEAETMRRAQKEEQARHLAEADKLRLKISEMETKLREKEREAQRQVENVKTQAVFANHAAHNSAIKARAASQRPMPTPLRGSPRGKGQEESFLLRTGVKGKGKALPPPPSPGPRFDTLKDAFSSTPTVSRVKRQRTESVFPAPSPSPPRPSPKTTPKKRMSEDDAGPSSPSPMADDGIANDVEPLIQEEHRPEPDLRGELLYHLFNYVSMSPFQQYIDRNAILQPNIYRMLHYRPPELLDKEGLYARSCGDLLRACGDGDSGLDGLLEVLAEVGMGMLRILLPALDSAYVTNADISAIVNILALLSRTAWTFTQFVAILSASSPSPASILQSIANRVFAPEKGISNLQTILDENSLPKKEDVPQLANPGVPRISKKTSPPPEQKLDDRRTKWVLELARGTGELTQTICWYAGGLDVWNGEELVDIVLGLTSAHLDIQVISQGITVIWSAATFKDNFRALMTQTSISEESQPVLERICRYIMSPPTVPADVIVYDIPDLLLKALAMLSIANRDAVLLIGQRSLVVPALIILLRRESNKIWGVWVDDFDLKKTLNTITIAVTVLHHLIYPHPIVTPPASSASQKAVPAYTLAGPDPPLSQAPSQANGEGDETNLQGINFVERIKELGSTTREFHGIGHQFMSCLGMMSYGQPACFDADEIESMEGVDLNLIQEMSQDVLEALVEGPEEEAVYELYADDEEEENGDQMDVDRVREEEEQDEVVDKDVYDAILVEDDSD